MAEQNQQRSGQLTGDIDLRALACTVIGFVASAIAIYVTVGGLGTPFKGRSRSAYAPTRLKRKTLATEEQNQQRSGRQRCDINLLGMTGSAIDLAISAIAIYVTTGALRNLFKRQYPSANTPSRITTKALAMDEQHQQRIGHETRDINIRAVTWAAIGLVISALAVYATVGGLFNLFKRQYPSPNAPSRITTPGRLPPQPRLQTRPADDLQQLREAENAKLNSYGWIDKSMGVVRIPIDRAMDLLAQRGLPARNTSSEIGGKTVLQMRQEKAEASHP